jgi:hypothetical protein
LFDDLCFVHLQQKPLRSCWGSLFVDAFADIPEAVSSLQLEGCLYSLSFPL